MRWKIGGLLFIILLCVGCTTSKYRLAEKLVEDREYYQAIRAYLRLLDPHLRDGRRYIYYDAEAVIGIGNIYWRMQRYQTAAKIFGMVVKKEPSNGKALFHLGMCFEGMGNDDGAIRVYRRYPYIRSSDAYRQVLIGRLDWNIKRKIAREIQMALENEAEMSLADIPENSVAVLYFISLSEDPQWRPLQKGLAEMMITDLSQVEDLKLIERLRVSQLQEELRLSASGLVDDSTAPRLGKLLGARNLVKGSYMVMPDLKMTLDAGIFEPERVSFPTTANFEGILSNLFQIEKELVLRILDNMGIELTPQQRQRILVIPTEDMMAFMNYCHGLEALDQGNFKGAQEYFYDAVRIDNDFQMAKDWIMSEAIWQATHNRNLRRVDYEIAELIKTTPGGESEITYTPPEAMISTWNRLQWMGIYQNAGFLPGNDTRESFQEAGLKGIPVLPQILGEPPKPPSRQ